MKFRFTKATNHNTQAYNVVIGDHICGMNLYISYNTVIAASTWNSQHSWRAQDEERYSNTTSRHRREMGVHGWPRVSQDELSRHIDSHLVKIGLAGIGWNAEDAA